jgi:hypothetical protein
MYLVIGKENCPQCDLLTDLFEKKSISTSWICLQPPIRRALNWFPPPLVVGRRSKCSRIARRRVLRIFQAVRRARRNICLPKLTKPLCGFCPRRCSVLLTRSKRRVRIATNFFFRFQNKYSFAKRRALWCSRRREASACLQCPGT